MARVIEAVQIFKKVEDVTAAKDDPSPVYLMDDLAEMARGSVESSEKIADRIAKRLQNKSPVVKFKALRLVRHLINKGCAQFQRAMQRHAELVRSHMNFKGEPDPYKGDTPNQRVRDAAKEAAGALFNTVMAQPVTGLGSRIQGFGSSAATGSSSKDNKESGSSFSGAPSASSNSRMVGFGSSGSSTYTAPSSNANGSTGGTFGGQRGVNRPLTGGTGGDSSGAGTGSSHGGYGAGGYSAPPIAAVEVLGSEEHLVDSICTPGGLRLAPDPDDLRRFVEAVGSLDGLKVAELLRDKMSPDGPGPWQQQLRALYALEAVLMQGASQACGEVAVMFQSDPGPVQAATAHTQLTLRDRAARVLKLLGGDGAAPAAGKVAAPAAAPTAAPAQPHAVDLLGGLDVLDVRAPTAQPTQLQQQVAQAATGDIFSGLAVPGGPPGSQQGYGSPYMQPSHGTGYSQQQAALHPAPQHHHQQYAPSNAAPAAPRQVVDPFEPLQPTGAYNPGPSVPSAAQTRPPYLQPQQQPLGYPQHQHGQGAGMLPQNGYGVVGPASGVPPGPVPASGSSYTATSRPPAQAPQPRNPGIPLDDMFADMSLSGAPLAPSQPAGMQPSGSGNTYGAAGASGTYGAPSQAYGAPANSGFAPNSAAYGAVPQAPPRPTGPSGVGMPMGAVPQYGGPQVGMMGGPGSGVGPAGPMQQQSRPAATLPGGPGPGGGAGGYDLMGSGAPIAGVPGGAGTAAWPAGGGSGGYAGAGPSGMGPGPGMGMLGGPGGMMVGPGGQVRYVGGPEAPGAPGVGGVGPAGQGQGGWQQPYAMQQPYGMPSGPQQQQPYGMPSGPQQQQPYGMAAPQQQAYQQRGGASFDFVMDQFRK